MYGTTYVMYVCATAFCGSWKSSYRHEGGGNCSVFWASLCNGYRKNKKLYWIKSDEEVLGFEKQYILACSKISSIHITSM